MIGLASASLLATTGSFDLVGQRAAGARDAVAHVVRGLVDVAVEVELDGDLRDLLAAERGQVADAVDADQLVLERLRDRGLDDLGRGAAVDGRDRRRSAGRRPGSSRLARARECDRARRARSRAT